MDEQEAKRSRLSSEPALQASIKPSLQGDRALHMDLLNKIEALDVKKFFHQLDENKMKDYQQYVKKPICFLDVRKNILADGGYRSHTSFIEDVELIFSNAIAFYSEKDPQLAAALELRQEWENMLIETDLIDMDADVYVSTEYEDELEESDSDGDSDEDFKTMEEKMLEEATMPLTEVIDRYEKSGVEAISRNVAKVEELSEQSSEENSPASEVSDDEDSTSAEESSSE